jgi:hypothetical protein
MKRLVIQQPEKMTLLQIIGLALILFGVLSLVAIAFQSLNDKSVSDNTFAAVAFFLIMIGFSLTFPGMLKSSTNKYSTMRIVVFMIVSLFVFLCVKIGWNCTELKDFKIDSTWGIILSAALGGKVVQSLGENNVFSRNQGTSLPANSSGGPGSTGQPGPNPSPGPPGSADIPVHDQTTISAKPPAGPPAYFNKTPGHS